MSLTQVLKDLVEDPMFYHTGFEISENHPDREDHEKRTRRDEEDCGCDKEEDDEEDDDMPIIRKPI